MVILLVTMGKALFLQFLMPLVVDVGEPCAALWQGVVLEDIRHMVEQSRHRKEHLRRCRSTLSFQKALRVAMSLLRRLGQPLDAFLLVLVDDLALKQQLPQQILRMGIPGLGGGVDVIHGFAGIFSYYLALQIFFAQSVGCIVVSVVGSVLQPLDAKLEIVDAGIVREQ